MKNKQIKSKLSMLKEGLKNYKKTYSAFCKKYENVDLNKQPINITILRNLSYTSNILGKINNNIYDIDKISKLENKSDYEQEIIDTKFLSSFLLLESLVDAAKNYDIKNYDYEILNIKLFETPLFNQKKNMMYQDFVKNHENEIIEDFDSVKVRIVEGFNPLAGVSDLLNDIGNQFDILITGLVDIAEFLGELLLDFVLILFELLKMLFNFIVDTLPSMISRTFNFISGFFDRFYKVGSFLPIWFIICFFLGSLLIYIVSSIPIDDPISDIQNIISLYKDSDNPPALRDNSKYLSFRRFFIGGLFGVLIGIWVFWYRIHVIENLQKIFIDYLISLIEKSKKINYLWSFAYQISLDHELFDDKTSTDRKKEILFDLFSYEGPLIIFRFLIGVAVIRHVLVFCFNHFRSEMIGLREISLTLSLFLKDLLSKFGFITSFIMKFIGGSDSIDVGEIEEE